MQVFRLMGMPDKVIAFNDLPERLLEGFEMCSADGFPRHWKEWMGKQKKVTRIPPEKDLLTGQVRRFEPIIEEDAFFYLVDWHLGPVVERWAAVCDFVRAHVDKETRLKDKIDDMAVPLAGNKSDSVTLEPEDVPVIPIPIEYQEKEPKLASLVGNEPKEIVPQGTIFKCPEYGCGREFEAKQALRMHTIKKHSKAKVAV